MSSDKVGKRAKCACSRIFTISPQHIETVLLRQAKAPGLQAVPHNDQTLNASKLRLDLEAERRKLQDAAEYWLVSKSLRSRAIGSIIFGSLAVLMGLSMLEEHSMNVILAFLGIFLLAEGIWVLAAPRPAGFVADGIALIVVGIWNVVVTAHNLAASGAEASPMFLILGVLQFGWGCQSFSRYTRFARVDFEEYDAWLVGRVDQMCKEMRKSRSRQREDIIVIKEGASTWIGQLGASVVILVKQKYEDIRIAPSSLASMRYDSSPKSAVKVLVRVGPYEINGMMKAKYIQRYEKWKAGARGMAYRAAEPEVPAGAILNSGECRHKIGWEPALAT